MSRSRGVLGVDPLDALLGESGARPKHLGPAAVASARRKLRATFHLPRSLVDEARNATVALSRAAYKTHARTSCRGGVASRDSTAVRHAQRRFSVPAT